MKLTTIRLPDELAWAAERAARRRQTSVSEVVREALASFLGMAGEPGARQFENLGRSGSSTPRDEPGRG
jgi:Arc/MetJ-type ribon-helix-helix transcriptional regulator